VVYTSDMTQEPISPSKASSRESGLRVPLAVIRRYAKGIADRFRPEKIILFGSYASGTPDDDSDVDLMVILACRNELDMAVKITVELPAPFPMDLLVRKPEEWLWRTSAGESFSKEIQATGKVLYSQSHARMGEKGRGRSPRSRRP
jgi:uncharacterized protein